MYMHYRYCNNVSFTAGRGETWKARLLAMHSASVEANSGHNNHTNNINT